MITVLSPSKKLNFKHQDAVSLFTQCDFIESAQELVNKAKNLIGAIFIIDKYDLIW